MEFKIREGSIDMKHFNMMSPAEREKHYLFIMSLPEDVLSFHDISVLKSLELQYSDITYKLEKIKKL